MTTYFILKFTDYVNELEQKQHDSKNKSSALNTVPKKLSHNFSTNTKAGKSEHYETLWDLEMEKENEDTIKGECIKYVVLETLQFNA